MASVTLVKNFDITARVTKFYKAKKLTLSDLKVTVAVDLPPEVIKELDKYNVVLADFHEAVGDWFASRGNFDDLLKDWEYCDEQMWTESFAKREDRAKAIQKKFETKFTTVYQKEWESKIEGMLTQAWKNHKAVGAKFKSFKIKCYLTLGLTVAGMVVATAAAIASAPAGVGIAGAAIGYVQGVGTCYATYKKLSTSLHDQVKNCDTKFKALSKEFADATKTVNAAVATAKKPNAKLKTKVQFKEAIKVGTNALTGGAADFIIESYSNGCAKGVTSSLKGFADSLETLEAKIDNFEQSVAESSGNITSLLDEQEVLTAKLEELRGFLTTDIAMIEKINSGASKDWSAKRKQLGLCAIALQKNEQNLKKTLDSIIDDKTRLKAMKKATSDWQKNCEAWQKTFGTKKIAAAVQFIIDAGAIVTGTGLNPSDWAEVGAKACGGLSAAFASYSTYSDTKDLFESFRKA